MRSCWYQHVTACTTFLRLAAVGVFAGNTSKAASLAHGRTLGNRFGMPVMKRIAMGIVGPGLVGGELLRQLEATKVQPLSAAKREEGDSATGGKWRTLCARVKRATVRTTPRAHGPALVVHSAGLLPRSVLVGVDCNKKVSGPAREESG